MPNKEILFNSMYARCIAMEQKMCNCYTTWERGIIIFINDHAKCLLPSSDHGGGQVDVV